MKHETQNEYLKYTLKFEQFSGEGRGTDTVFSYSVSADLSTNQNVITGNYSDMLTINVTY